MTSVTLERRSRIIKPKSTAFLNERVDLELNGVLSQRPSTGIVERGRESGLVR
jgi:hypothetical protein